MAKRINTLLRHGDLPREEDGAIEFWRLKDDLRNRLEHSQYWSDVCKSKMAGVGGNNQKNQGCKARRPEGFLFVCRVSTDVGVLEVVELVKAVSLIPQERVQVDRSCGRYRSTCWWIFESSCQVW